jgi:hypothetical protein
VVGNEMREGRNQKNGTKMKKKYARIFKKCTGRTARDEANKKNRSSVIILSISSIADAEPPSNGGGGDRHQPQ